MARRGGLGRGLGALIPAEGSDATTSVLREMAVGSISANVNQPRNRFDEEALSSLVASVRELGVLQPILVRPWRTAPTSSSLESDGGGPPNGPGWPPSPPWYERLTMCPRWSRRWWRTCIAKT